jgi:hypothetical protein
MITLVAILVAINSLALIVLAIAVRDILSILNELVVILLGFVEKK